VPGKGRFLLSIYPRNGYSFEKAGVIAGNKLYVILDDEMYVISSDNPILTANNWNIYLLRQPFYRMTEQEELNYTVGATSKIEED
jgi:hypothetical protein